MEKNKQKLQDYAQAVETALESAIPAVGEPLVRDAMRYSLLGAGKRIRAALVLELAQLCGATQEQAMPFACAIEMIHAYSLIHDDLPCMDDDDFRRGKPACHKQFGEAYALLAGDALLTLAFETVCSAPLCAQRCAKAVGALAKAAGYGGMIGGQMLDLQAENRAISLAELQQIYRWKTGALLSVSAQLGCIAGDADASFLETVQAYTEAFGLLFQITDDILDVVGTMKELGKPIGSDAEQEKTTYVSLLGLEGAQKAAREQAEVARLQAQKLPHPDFLLWLVEMVCTRNH